MNEAGSSFGANGEELRLRGWGMKVVPRLGGVTDVRVSLVTGNLNEVALVGVDGEERDFAEASRGIEEGEEAIFWMRSGERVKLEDCSSSTSTGSKVSSSGTPT